MKNTILPEFQDFLVSRSLVHAAHSSKMIENHYGISTIQTLLGHRNLRITMIYTHVATKKVAGVRSLPDK